VVGRATPLQASAALIAQLADDAEIAAEHLEAHREDDEAARARALAEELRTAAAHVDIDGVEVQVWSGMTSPSLFQWLTASPMLWLGVVMLGVVFVFRRI